MTGSGNGRLHELQIENRGCVARDTQAGWDACEETIRSRAEGLEETRFVLNQLSVEEELEKMKLSHGREFE